MLTLTACIHAMPPNQTINTKLTALYLASSSEDASTTDIRKQVKSLGIEIVQVPSNISAEEVKALTKDVIILYLEPATVNTFDASIYQDWYGKGKVIVALGTQINLLATKIGISANIEDLRLEHQPEDFFVASFFQSATSNGLGVSMAATNFYYSFNRLDESVRHSAVVPDISRSDK